MKRSGFRQTVWAPAAKTVHQPLASAPNYSSAAGATVPPIKKGEHLRNEHYLRAVASLPCCVCGIVGYSQAAHANRGKGAGFKTDDRTCFALCCDRPGVKGCHPKFDQYELYPKAAAALVAEAWGADTRRRLVMMGKWPKDLPMLEEVAHVLER